MNKPEILAPAGSFDALKAAIAAGADAVYLGGSAFGARAYADNFMETELLQAIDYVHLKKKKIYLTVNTLLKESEFDTVYDFLKAPYKEGLDAVIVQDLGVADYVRKQFPDLHLHASTQMTVTNVYGARLLKEMGAVRIVPARELSLMELSAIKKATGMEIEVFVHGALCYCYSGQCLFSSMLGGRSGNRGRCAQPCRLPYSIAESNKMAYILSPKDLCGLEAVPELIKAGVDSFKIEGRMKKPEYVRAAVEAYRCVTDAYFSDTLTPNLIEKQKERLLDVYNRGGFTEGYYNRQNGKEMMSMDRPNHMGIYVGKIEKIAGNTITFTAKRDIGKQDVLEIVTGGEKGVELTSPVEKKAGEKITLNGKEIKRLKIGQLIYRTKNQTLLTALAQTQNEKKSKEKIKGNLILKKDNCAILYLQWGDMKVKVEGPMVEAAKQQPVTKKEVLDKLMQLGDTPYVFASCDVDMDEDAFISMKYIKSMRRQAVEALQSKQLSADKRELPAKVMPEKNEKAWSRECIQPKLSVLCRGIQQLKAVVDVSEIERVYLDTGYIDHDALLKGCIKLRENGKQVFLVMPGIFRKRASDYWEQLMEQNQLFDGVLVKNIDAFAYLFYKKYEGSIVCDSSLYGYNNQAVAFYRQYFKEISFTYPMELNKRELLEVKGENRELVVYGYQPLMISAQCVKKNTVGCNETQKEILMQDRVKEQFYVHNVCKYCYNVIYNGIPYSLTGLCKEVKELAPAFLRIDFLNESTEQIQKIVSDVVNEFVKEKEVTRKNSYRLTRGHFKKGIE